jgi:hypothetical protein
MRRLITVKQWAKGLDVRLPRAYELARRLPPGVRVQLGRQLRIDEERADDWLANGGTLNATDNSHVDSESARSLLRSKESSLQEAA